MNRVPASGRCPECLAPTRNPMHCDRCRSDYSAAIRRRKAAELRLPPLGW